MRTFTGERIAGVNGGKIASVVVLMVALLLVMGCSKKEGDGTASSGKEAPEKKSGVDESTLKSIQEGDATVLAKLTQDKATPSSEFEYAMSDSGDGVAITKYTGTNDMVVIPDQIEGLPVVQIGVGKQASDTDHKVFSPNETIRAVVLPNSVKVIGSYAFAYCTELSAINLPEGLTEIRSTAFSSTGLVKVNIPNGIKTLNTMVFEYCEKLVSVSLPSSINTMNYGVFIGCSSLTDITIPDSVKSIKFDYQGAEEFGGCSKLSLGSQKRLRDLGYKRNF